ncbi:DUF3179 domain-containing protein [Haloglomus halophilum]|jgi:hypothetical protein|uniref:DUF3179 domain-containing protein n=1 Tax=Haloglomus halophilum TaxID=2962672 RepID=UPI0020C9E9D3|nr:DUF3179 domain-containing protein [Haloglomus halophilum]
MNVRRVVPRDAIPSVDDPSFGERYDGEADDTVIAVENGERARAYPVRYLHYHEIVNDTIGDDPIAVTWCPLCGSAVVYDRRHRGRVLEFGVSGKLADDDLVMYDRESESEWKQSSGECIAGRFAGDSLSVRPGAMLSWREFRDAHPDGVVLQPPGGKSEAASDDDDPAPIDYDTSPYADYFAGEGFGLAAHRGTDDDREWTRDDLRPKTAVLGFETDDTALGFPLPRVLDAGGVVQTTVEERPVLVVATEAGDIHGFADPRIQFGWTGAGLVGDGTTWDPATGRAADGRRLDRLPARRVFAFTWRDDHGPDAFYDAN